MNVTEEQLKTYIELFISTLKSTAQNHLDISLHNELLHLSLLPAEIVGYVSTNYGVALEYIQEYRLIGGALESKIF